MYDTLLFDIRSVSIGPIYRFCCSLQAELNSPEGVCAEPVRPLVRALSARIGEQGQVQRQLIRGEFAVLAEIKVHRKRRQRREVSFWLVESNINPSNIES